MDFKSKLLGAIEANNSFLCLGLDPYLELMSIKDPVQFNLRIIEATFDLVCAYKFNLAFYEALGIEGLRALEKSLTSVPENVPKIGDAKRGDIGPASSAYARALFERWGFDGATVNPYLGYDSIEPFLNYSDKGVFLLCRSSNPGAGDFQEGVFELVAKKAREWNRWGNIGLVVGANHPEIVKKVRGLCPGMLLLLPGVGVQGGEIETAVKAAKDNFIVSISRSIIYASSGEDFALKAREAAQDFRELINYFRERR